MTATTTQPCNYCRHAAFVREQSANGQTPSIVFVPDPTGAFRRAVRVRLNGEDTGLWYAHVPKRCQC